MNQSLSGLQQRFLAIATDSNLSPKQKSNFLALEVEATIPYMTITKYGAEGSGTRTTFLGAEAAKNTGILGRSPRVVSHEMSPTYVK